MKTLLFTLSLILPGLGSLPALANSELPLHQAASGNLYVHASLGSDIDTDMLLDTGASYVALSKATFARISDEGGLAFSRYIYGAVATGKVEKVALYRLESLRLSDTCILEDIEVALLPRADTDILGLNALSRIESLTLQFAPARLSTGTCQSAT